MDRLTTSFCRKKIFCAVHLKSQARLGDSEALQDLVCHWSYYLLIFIIPDLKCLLSAFLFSTCPLHFAHIFSVLPTAPPFFTGNLFSPEPLLS